MKGDDHSLVRRCLRGETEAFALLVEKYQKPVFHAACRMLHDDDDANDVCQTVFLRAFERLESFDFRHRFYSWLYRIAINESLDCLSRRKRLDPLDEEPAASQPSPEQQLRGGELAGAVRASLMDMKPDQRSVLVLRHVLHCSYRQMAFILDIPEKTVKSRLFSARQTLRDRLVARGVL